MNKLIFVFIVFLSLQSFNIYGQCGGVPAKTPLPASIGMIIYSNDVETVWNALRFANFSKSAGDTVSIFLLGKGVELDSLVKWNEELKEEIDNFLKSGGIILGCGTCLEHRNNNEPQICKFSSMADLYDLIRRNRIVLTF